MMNRLVLLFFGLILLTPAAEAQTSTAEGQDPTPATQESAAAVPGSMAEASSSIAEAPQSPQESTLSLDEYLKWVDSYHPLVKSVRNKLPIAKAQALQARGSFDPTLVGNFASKEYNDDLYYRLPNWKLTTRTRGPLTLDVDWNQTAGIYTNPQDKLPEEGLFAVGGMVQLGNGLLTDKRRTDLALAKAAVGLTEAEADLYRNELLFKAAKAYWKWYSTDQSLTAYQRAIATAQEVYDFTLRAFKAGDASAMDTLDARALLTTWQSEYYSARKSAIEARYDASTWLWNEEGAPVVLDINTRPAEQRISITDYPTLDPATHPLWQYNSQKERQFALKKRLANEYLKPKVAVGGALLLPGNFQSVPEVGNLNTADRVLKAKVEVPLFLREGRGYSKSTKLQLEQFQWERSASENAWTNELQAAAQSIIALEEATRASEENQKIMEALLRAEQRKLELGDSELIKVNLRTNYFMKSLIQTAKYRAELGTKRAEFAQLSAAF